MKKIMFHKLTIENFCGIEHKEIDLTSVTQITGDNETGKSTIGGAITWLLCGTNLEGDLYTDVIPTTTKDTVSPRVTLEMSIQTSKTNIKMVTLGKVYKANRNKQKEFTGEYTNELWLNDAKIIQKEYKEWVDKHICDSDIMPMLINPKIFTEKLKSNSKELLWQKQRRIISSLVETGETDIELVEELDDFSFIKDGINKHGDVVLYHRQLKGNLTKYNNSSDGFATKKQTLERQIQPTSHDMVAIESKLKELALCIGDLENGENKQHLLQIQALQKEKKEVEEVFKNKTSADYELANQMQLEIKEIERKISDKRIEYRHQVKLATENTQKFSKGVRTSCSICGQDIPDDRIKEIQESRMNEISAIKEKANKFVEDGKVLKEKYTAENEKLNKLKSEISQAEEKLKSEISQADNLIEKLFSEISQADNLEKKRELEKEVDGLKQEMFIHNQNDMIMKQIEESKIEHKEVMKKISQIQQGLDMCLQFMAYKREILSEKVNSLFAKTGIEFRLFKKNKTNDEIQESFEILYNGKEYHSQLSLSTKTIVSYYITNALQKTNNVLLPIIIDNIESVNFHEKPKMQLIALKRIAEKCEKCNGVSGRRNKDNTWTCLRCENVWNKNITIENLEIVPMRSE